MNEQEKTYTREEVSRAVNDGANLVGDSDTINLVVNAALTLLDNPEARLGDVILENYQPDLDESDIDPDNLVEGYDAEQSAIIREVLSWVESE